MADDNVFAEKYVLLRKLGEGGMAEIYLARQLGLGGFHKELVIKRIHRELTKNEGYVELFLDEARIAANLNHPHVVHIYDIGKAYGTYYIAMEHIHGADLMDICRRGIQEGRFLPLPMAVNVISQVAEGLGYAHDYSDEHGNHLGIVHRDISPSNILVSYTGVAKLVDFGIAKAATQMHDDRGKVMGKVNYMSPEQIRGLEVDGRSDLFSLGVVLYEVAAGRRLFRGTNEEVVRRILQEPIPPPSLVRPDFPSDLEVIIMRLLERKPENRYQDAGELHQDLEDFISESGWKGVPRQLSRYLLDLYDVDGVPEDLDDEAMQELGDDEAVDLDRPAGSFDDDFAKDDGEVIFASRMPDSFSQEMPAAGGSGPVDLLQAPGTDTTPSRPTTIPPPMPPSAKAPAGDEPGSAGPQSAASPEESPATTPPPPPGPTPSDAASPSPSSSPVSGASASPSAPGEGEAPDGEPSGQKPELMGVVDPFASEGESFPTGGILAPPEPRKSRGWLVALVVMLILLGGGALALWWLTRH